MAIQNTEAIVLRTQDFRETSLIATFYTRDFGKVKGIVKGLKRPKARFGSTLEPFSYNQLVFYQKRQGELHTVSGCDLREVFAPIRLNLEKTAYASYFIELLDVLTQVHDKNEPLFELILAVLKLFSDEPASLPTTIARAFEIKALDLSGFMPRLDSCVACASSFYCPVREERRAVDARFSYLLGGLLCHNCFGEDTSARPIMRGTIASIDFMQRSDWQSVLRFKADSNISNELEPILRAFLDFHLERHLKTISFLKKITPGKPIYSPV